MILKFARGIFFKEIFRGLWWHKLYPHFTATIYSDNVQYMLMFILNFYIKLPVIIGICNASKLALLMPFHFSIRPETRSTGRAQYHSSRLTAGKTRLYTIYIQYFPGRTL